MGGSARDVLKDIKGLWQGVVGLAEELWSILFEGLHELFMKATTNSIFKVCFGIDLDNMSGPSEE
ncbi:hypothetical protein Tco_0735651, partial [Tanacetum coccineum]